MWVSRIKRFGQPDPAPMVFLRPLEKVSGWEEFEKVWGKLTERALTTKRSAYPSQIWTCLGSPQLLRTRTCAGNQWRQGHDTDEEQGEWETGRALLAHHYAHGVSLKVHGRYLYDPHRILGTHGKSVVQVQSSCPHIGVVREARAS